jgi:hypothetical protein
MASIKIIILDDFGQEVCTKEQKLVGVLDNIANIEAEVELFRRQMLPEISKHFLEASQEAYKKKDT